MQFTYHPNSKNETILIDGNIFTHLIKARRVKLDENLFFRNLIDDNLYTYEFLQIGKKNATCKLVNTIRNSKKNSKKMNLAWSIVEPKIVEKTIPMLNEIGVNKITFIYTDFSQKNFQIDFDRLNRVAISSCEQCGRSNLMEFDIKQTLHEFINENPKIGVVDFSKNRLESITCELPQTWLVGCEGGFSTKERELLVNNLTIGFSSNTILKSETAAVAISTKILL